LIGKVKANWELHFFARLDLYNSGGSIAATAMVKESSILEK